MPGTTGNFYVKISLAISVEFQKIFEEYITGN